MRILWLINIPLPEASILMNEKPSPYGGWLVNASKVLSLQENLELYIAFPSSKSNEFKRLKGERINYYLFTLIKYGDTKTLETNRVFIEILKEVNPDIVHIYGTEMTHTLSMINACEVENVKTVVSIQGLVSIYAKHMYADLPFYAVYGFTLRNLIRRDNVHGLKKTFELRGKNEIEALEKTKNIIGRTTWDKACSEQINPKAVYYFCNEILREEFYKHEWNINDCERNSIFLSQGQYSIKGLHYMLVAMPLILKKYPEAKVYISGKDITKSDTVKDKLLMTYYGKYIKRMIRTLDVEKNVIFTGPLDEKDMCERYLKSHVFVCPSSIENSPNSLGEAMILGVPCVSSDVGGVADMIKHKEDGFVYQADAPYMLAHYICEIFDNDELAISFSANAKKHAHETHNIMTNTSQLVSIYRKILMMDNEKEEAFL